MKAKFNNSFIIHSKYFPILKGVLPFHSLFSSHQNNTTSSSGFLGQQFNNLQRAALLTSMIQYGKTLDTIYWYNMSKFFPNLINPLTPVPSVTACDEPWPFFHFWHHHFWPKLASSILNFCRGTRSFQWYPDQSDWPNGALNMHKNAQKVEWKTQSKISCHYTWPAPC